MVRLVLGALLVLIVKTRNAQEEGVPQGLKMKKPVGQIALVLQV